MAKKKKPTRVSAADKELKAEQDTKHNIKAAIKAAHDCLAILEPLPVVLIGDMMRAIEAGIKTLEKQLGK